MLHVGGDNIESGTGKLLDLTPAREQRLISGKYLFDQTTILYSKIRPALNKVVAPDFKGICQRRHLPSSAVERKDLEGVSRPSAAVG